MNISEAAEELARLEQDVETERVLREQAYQSRVRVFKTFGELADYLRKDKFMPPAESETEFQVTRRGVLTLGRSA